MTPENDKTVCYIYTFLRRQQLSRSEARHDRRQPDVLARRGRGRGRVRGRGRGGARAARAARRARARRPAHGLRPDHALFPQPQGINRHTPSHHASRLDVAVSLASSRPLDSITVSMFDVLLLSYDDRA